MPIALMYMAMLAFDLSVISGTAYVVFWLGHSGWWWLLAGALLLGSDPRNQVRALLKREGRTR